ncbi:MAG: hypothetical protein GXP36_14645 [Actinobacteria bacterium]|nr:hypothetical protein [Actinomycetota bacterium]
MPSNSHSEDGASSRGEETARAVIVAASNMVPFVGGTLAEVIEQVWIDPFRRRVEEFVH